METSRIDSMMCSYCEKVPDTDQIYVCASGHMICGRCYSQDHTRLEKCSNCGNPVLPNSCAAKPKSKKKHDKDRKAKYEAISENNAWNSNGQKISLRNLAGGDSKIHPLPTCKPVKNKNCTSDGEIMAKNQKSAISVKSRLERSKSAQNLAKHFKETYQLKVGFRNVNFSDSKSTIEDLSDNTQLDKTNNNSVQSLDITRENIIRNVPERPITCPVSECSRMVALSSMMAHFCFDHNRVPFISTLTSTAETTALNVDALTPCESHCVAFFVLPGMNRSNIQSTYQANMSLFILLDRFKDSLWFPLMVARLPFQHPPGDIFKVFIKSPTEEKQYTSKYTQTSNEHLLRHDRFIPIPEKTNHVLKDAFIGEFHKMHYEEVLILWLCGVTDTSYTITLKGTDTTYSHSYSGKVRNIREKQDPLFVYQEAECLVVQGAAVNRLITQGSGKILFIELVIG